MDAALNEDRVRDFRVQVIGDAAAALSGVTVSIGDRLGLYTAIAGAGPLTSQQVATSTALVERCVREWLAVQVASRYVDYDPVAGTYTLPDERAAVLADPMASTYLAGKAYTGRKQARPGTGQCCCPRAVRQPPGRCQPNLPRRRGPQRSSCSYVRDAPDAPGLPRVCRGRDHHTLAAARRPADRLFRIGNHQRCPDNDRDSAHDRRPDCGGHYRAQIATGPGRQRGDHHSSGRQTGPQPTIFGTVRRVAHWLPVAFTCPRARPANSAEPPSTVSWGCRSTARRAPARRQAPQGEIACSTNRTWRSQAGSFVASTT